MLIRKLITKLVLRGASARSAHHLSPLQGVSDLNDTVELAYSCYESSSCDTKRPVIILHGLLCSKKSWANMSEAIHKTTGRKVINVDARNHGESPHASEHTYIDMARDTAKLIKTLDLGNVTLLGHSMGGRTAMVTSLLYPELVSSLMLVDISPISMSEQLTNNFPRVLEIINRVDFKGITNVEDATRSAVEQLRSHGITQEDMLNFITKNVGNKPDKTAGWISNMTVLKEYFPTLLKFPHKKTYGKTFTGPAYFLAAGLSDFVPPEDFTGIKGYFPRAQLKHLPGVRHNIHAEDPSTFLKLATEFIQNDVVSSN